MTWEKETERKQYLVGHDGRVLGLIENKIGEKFWEVINMNLPVPTWVGTYISATDAQASLVKFHGKLLENPQEKK